MLKFPEILPATLPSFWLYHLINFSVLLSRDSLNWSWGLISVLSAEITSLSLASGRVFPAKSKGAKPSQAELFQLHDLEFIFCYIHWLRSSDEKWHPLCFTEVPWGGIWWLSMNYFLINWPPPAPPRSVHSPAYLGDAESGAEVPHHLAQDRWSVEVHRVQTIRM